MSEILPVWRAVPPRHRHSIHRLPVPLCPWRVQRRPSVLAMILAIGTFNTGGVNGRISPTGVESAGCPSQRSENPSLSGAGQGHR